MLGPESLHPCLRKRNFILVRITSVDSEISIVDLLGIDLGKKREKESKEQRTYPVH